MQLEYIIGYNLGDMWCPIIRRDILGSSYVSDGNYGLPTLPWAAFFCAVVHTCTALGTYMFCLNMTGHFTSINRHQHITYTYHLYCYNSYSNATNTIYVVLSIGSILLYTKELRWRTQYRTLYWYTLLLASIFQLKDFLVQHFRNNSYHVLRIIYYNHISVYHIICLCPLLTPIRDVIVKIDL